MVARERVVGPLCRRQSHGSAIHESPRLGLLPLRVQRQQRRELGLGAAVGYDDDLRHQDEESHPVGAVAVASQQQDNGQCEISRILDRRSALRSSGCSRQSRVYQLVEVGGLRHQWRVPLRRGVEVEPPDLPGRHVALRRGFPRPARHQVRRAVHKGPRQLRRVATSRTTSTSSIRYRWTQSVDEHAGVVRRHRAALLQQQGYAQSVPDGPHRRLDRACSSTISGRLPSA